MGERGLHGALDRYMEGGSLGARPSVCEGLVPRLGRGLLCFNLAISLALTTFT